MLVSVVVPCYNSENTIRELVEMSMEEIRKIPGYDCEFILVNDCSKDRTFEVIEGLCRDYPNVRGINLMRNFGQHCALMCAMNYARGDLILGMDDDMQTHPSQIPTILKYQQKGFDVVYGVYEKTLNSPAKRFTSWFNKITSRWLLGRPKDIRSSNFWVITSKVKREVIKFKNWDPYVDAIFFRVTHNIGNVKIEHHKREYGRSGYTLWKLMKLWLAYFNYSIVPLRVAAVLGTITSLLGFICALVTIIHKLVDPTTTVGWASTVSLMLIFFGFTLLVLGVIGEYVGEIVLSINSTPQFIVRETLNMDGEETDRKASAADSRGSLRRAEPAQEETEAGKTEKETEGTDAKEEKGES